MSYVSLYSQTGFDSTVSVKIVSNFPQVISGNLQEFKANATIQLINLEKTEIKVALQGHFISSGWGFTSNPKYKKMISLGPYETFVIDASNWAAVLDLEHANYMGVTLNQIQAEGFPDSTMSICLTAVAEDNSPLSEQDCQTMVVRHKTVGKVLSCGTTLYPSGPDGKINIMWTPSDCQGVLYNVFLKIVPHGNEVKAVMSSAKYPFVFMDVVSTPSITIATKDLSGCSTGSTIGMMIKHKDPFEKNVFQHKGLSEPCSFHIGTHVTPAVHVADTVWEQLLVSKLKDSTLIVASAPVAMDKSENSIITVRYDTLDIVTMIKIKKGDTIVPGTRIHLLSVKRKKMPAGRKAPAGQEATPGFLIENYQIIKLSAPAALPVTEDKKKKK
jgi:hypothetical protein